MSKKIVQYSPTQAVIHVFTLGGQGSSLDKYTCNNRGEEEPTIFTQAEKNAQEAQKYLISNT